MHSGIVSTEDDRLFVSDTGNDGITCLRALDLDTVTFSTVRPLGADDVALAYAPEPSLVVLQCYAAAFFPLAKNRRG